MITSMLRKHCVSGWCQGRAGGETDRRSVQLVERIARVPPETVKINLQVATMGMDMMGLRDALTLDNQLSAPPMSCCAKNCANRWTMRAPTKGLENICRCATVRFNRNRLDQDQKRWTLSRI